MQLALPLITGVAVLLAFMSLIFWALDRGGWERLAKEYPAEGTPVGERFRFASGRVGRELVVSGLTVNVTESGVGLVSVLPFGFRPPFHRLLYIPWTSILRDVSGASRHEFALQVATVHGPISLELTVPLVGRSRSKLKHVLHRHLWQRTLRSQIAGTTLP